MLLHFPCSVRDGKFVFLGGLNTDLHGHQHQVAEARPFSRGECVMRGSELLIQTQMLRVSSRRKTSYHVASCITVAQISNGVITFGTTAVLPFYALMVLAPKAELTKRSMESNIPYAVLGVAYAVVLYLSWTTETLRLLFSSKYLLPELHGIAKMFSNELTLASAWIHLLAVDLFAARQIYQDGQKNDVETRHSVILCLFSCPIGVLTHVLTTFLTKRAGML